jgi:competence protein ComFB
MQIKNYMEDIVWQKIDKVMERHPDFCGCEKCRYDIVALALNFLPPRYVVNDKGETYTKVHSLEQQFNIDIITALTNAITIVSKLPHHDAKE